MKNKKIAKQPDFITEQLHPELQEIVAQGLPDDTFNHLKAKHKRLISKIKDLVKRGEKTGMEQNMPAGSSRAYMPHVEPHEFVLDGKPAKMKVGTKIAIPSSLDKYHLGIDGNVMSLGQMQNQVEIGTLSRYRTIQEDSHGNYITNEHGVLPPMMDHDYKNHEYAVVGHARDLKPQEFGRLTANKDFPRGISHKDFCNVLEREFHRANGRAWERGGIAYKLVNKKMDKILAHPFVKEMSDFVIDHDIHPSDFRQKKNLGVWQHPHTGKEQIVARDTGFTPTVNMAYSEARKRKYRIKW